jgi:uncharacterized protein YndB with AHSA1/START domain
MTVGSENYPAQKGKVVKISRVLDAPRDLVWETVTKPEHIVHWSHAGEGWTTPFAEMDVRTGGKIRIGYGSPDGKDDFVLEATFREVDPPRRMVWLFSDGRSVTFTLEDLAGRTKLTIDLTLETEYPEEMQRQGWGEHIDNLANYLAERQRKSESPQDVIRSTRSAIT